MDEKKFDDLIQRLEHGNATPEEKALLEKWLAQRSAEDPFSKLAGHDQIRDGIFSKISPHLSPQQKKAPEGIQWWNVYRVAAAVLLLATISYFLWQYSSDRGQFLEASSQGKTNKVMLADGSIVWLKGNSRLTYPSTFTGAERRVTLTGEALFEVAKDSLHPFMITTGDLTARVLGTSFNIKTTDSNIEVLVLTGKVALSSEGTAQKIIVLPNEKALFDKTHRQLSKVEPLEEEPVQAVSKTEYSMNFKSTQMREVIRSIEAKFDVQISLKDKAINNCTVTADFTDQSLERTMNMISMALGFAYEINGDAVTISGVGCE